MISVIRSAWITSVEFLYLRNVSMRGLKFVTSCVFRFSHCVGIRHVRAVDDGPLFFLARGSHGILGREGDFETARLPCRLQDGPAGAFPVTQ